MAAPTTAVPDVVDEMLAEGLRQQLFTGAAVAVVAPSGGFTAVCGQLAADDPTPVDESSLFDLASLTKCFVAHAACRLALAGRVDLDEPVSRFIRVGSGRGAERITLRMLLSHTSGLPAESRVWEGSKTPRPADAERVVSAPLDAAPSTRFHYSCVGYIAAGLLLERVERAPLAQILADWVFQPLGLARTGFGPVPATRALATEAQPWLGRGTVRGEVHDELAWHLGGRVGNAGLFAPIGDVVRFAARFCDPPVGDPSGADRDVVRLMCAPALPPGAGADHDHGLGVRIGDLNFLATRRSYGHTGFTGTMWAVDPEQRTTTVLLTNRVHCGRDRADIGELRRRIAGASRGLSDRPAAGRGPE